MSRLGKKPLHILDGVRVDLRSPNIIVISGSKGMLEYMYNDEIRVEHADNANELFVSERIHSKTSSANCGTTVRLIMNMIEGVKNGFQKQMELNGVGYRMSLSGDVLHLALGFSHPVDVKVPGDIQVKIENNILTLSGIDKQRVGQFAAEIRELKPVEPYKGKGFRYVGEIVRKKEGKKAGS